MSGAPSPTSDKTIADVYHAIRDELCDDVAFTLVGGDRDLKDACFSDVKGPLKLVQRARWTSIHDIFVC